MHDSLRLPRKTMPGHAAGRTIPHAGHVKRTPRARIPTPVTRKHARGTSDGNPRAATSKCTIHQEGLGPSVVGWFQELAGIEEDDQIANKLFVEMVVVELTRRLQADAPPVKRAPSWPSIFAAPMEKLVMDPAVPEAVRITAVFKLIKFWGRLRFNDAAT